MSFTIHADLVPLFRGLVIGLRPYAKAQDVDLMYNSCLESLQASYNPEMALSQITVLLTRIIMFTPQGYNVSVTLEKGRQQKNQCSLRIENTGANLSKMGDIISAVDHGLCVEALPKGTCFLLEIPTCPSTILPESKNNTLLPKPYPMYFAEVHKRLANYFSKTEHFEKTAHAKAPKNGIFLKKVNAVIHSNMVDPDFKVDALADCMALSRTQLYRKIKCLTQMSPQEYLRFVRLETAKKILQSNQKDLNVSEVCYEVGFSSKSHFSRAFQKEFGFSPSFYKSPMQP